MHAVGAKRNLGDVAASIGHKHFGHALVGELNTEVGVLGNGTLWGGLAELAASVGEAVVIEDEDVHVNARGHDVVDTREIDIVCPAVTTNEPVGLLWQEVRVQTKRPSKVVFELGFGKNLQQLGLGGAGGSWVLIGGEPALQSIANSRMSAFGFDGSFSEFLESLSLALIGNREAETESCIIFEGRGGDSWAAPIDILLVRAELIEVTPNKAATNGGADNKVVTIKSGEHAGNNGLWAAWAGAWTEEIWLEEFKLLERALLAFLKGGELGAVFNSFVPLGLVLSLDREWLHGDAALRASLGADFAAAAVNRRNVNNLLVLLVWERADAAMWASRSANIALDAVVATPSGNWVGSTRSLIAREASWEDTRCEALGVRGSDVLELSV